MKKTELIGTDIRKVPVKHFPSMMKMFLILLLTSLFFVSQAAAQQKKQLSGTVADPSGEPLIGASIIEKGTTNGTLTNINGMFSLQVEENAVIQVSYIGFLSQEISTAGRTSLTITLLEDTRSLEEVVVVGYGTQKKANLTGAVDQVGEKVFVGRPMPNVTQGLQGVVPNLNIALADGKPSRTASYQIRGVTSIGQGGSALVIIDGVEGDPAMLNPNDIASISVLKDASSAAIYGARGAFGVVLITTKNPEKGRTSVTYNASVVAKSPTRIPDMVTDANLYATMFVEAYSSYYDYARTPSTFHKAVPYTVDWHNEMARRPPGSGKPEVEIGPGGNYQYFANNNWYEMLYKDRAFGHEHNIAIQGGTDRADFILSSRYYNQGGIFQYNSDDYSMLNIRAKGSAQIFNWLKVENNVAITQSNYFNPLTVADGNVWYGLESEAEPMSPMFNPDGTLTMAAAYSVGDMWYGKSGINTRKMLLHNTTSFTASFLDNAFRLKGDISFRNPYNRETTKRVPVPYSPAPDVIAYLGSGTNDFGEANTSTNYMATNIYGEYEKTFAETHYFKGMLGYNYEQSLFNSIFTQRNGLIFEDVNNINLTNGSGITISVSHEKWRIAGGFFRFNYGYKDRYLIEVNGRLDGSTKFPVDQQWGFFPSISAGWRLSEEPFWNLNNIFSDVKLRASYGSLGVGNIASYTFQELFTISTMGRLIQGTRQQKTSAPPVLPDGLTWETSTTANLGLDFGVLKGRLRFAGDIYTRKTKDMFAVGIDLPATFGATAPKGNYADMKTNGWEMTLSWRNDHTLAGKPFSYDVRVTLADYVSKITKYTNPEKELGAYWDARANYYEGMTIGEIWGYVTEGFFTSDEDVANHASQRLYFASNSGKWLPGDIKFRDLNNDGVIDYGTNKVNDPGDRKVIGNTTPRYTYGINLGVNWSNIFISGFFQGVGKQDWWPGTDNALFWGQYNRPYNNIPKSMLGNIWTVDNPDAYFPRYRGYVALQSSRELAVTQTRYLQNVAYIRLKNLQVGYNLPRHIASSIRMQNARVYMSAENLWGWSPLYKITKNFDFGSIYGTDIEQAQSVPSSGIANGSQVYNYPILKSVSFGVSVTF
jgi:TonB-linked SusC/RagA family outer membrane protein